MRLVIAAALVLAALPTTARSEETADQILQQFRHACNGEALSHVEQSTCLADAVKRMKVRLTAEYKKALAWTDATAPIGSMGGRSGAQIARTERSELIRAEKSWEAFNQAECARRTDEIDLGGSNSGDIVGASCDLEHMAERIVELEN